MATAPRRVRRAAQGGRRAVVRFKVFVDIGLPLETPAVLRRWRRSRGVILIFLYRLARRPRERSTQAWGPREGLKRRDSGKGPHETAGTSFQRGPRPESGGAEKQAGPARTQPRHANGLEAAPRRQTPRRKLPFSRSDAPPH